MKLPLRSRTTGFSAWQRGATERLRQAWHRLQQWLAVDHPPQALAWIPVRDLPPHAARALRRRSWRD